MSTRVIGQVRRVNGPVITASGITDAGMLELVFVGEVRIVGEIVKLEKSGAVIQVYEEPTGIRPGENIYGTGKPLSVELGPGLIGSIYDGIQRPLEKIRDLTGPSIERGISLPSLDREKQWHFVPSKELPETVGGGTCLGTVVETENLAHRIMVPPGIGGALEWLAGEDDYTVTTVVARVATPNGPAELPLFQQWPIRTPRPVLRRLPFEAPLITGQRVIDSLFPVARGGTVAIPGGFGTGKTMTQHAVAKWCDADIIVYIGCGERGNEMTDVLTSFPEIIDPRTGKSLMERTVLIANTSNMPVSAREASIYTGATIAEYFRDQGLQVALMADSTSRWAEALRELSGRMEEMPAEEGFPAYLPTRIAEFYERAGRMETLSGTEGSVSIIGAVSPPGGDFSEPVTQHTRRFIRCFWGLDRQLANSRHYPAISWLDSYSEYVDDIKTWWEEHESGEFIQNRQEIIDLLHREVRLNQVVKLVGPDALPDSQRFILEVCTMFKNAFLQQNAFDDIDRYSTVRKQAKMLAIILTYYRLGAEAIKRGVTILELRRLPVLREVVKMKMTVPNDEIEKLDTILSRLEQELTRLEGKHV